MQVSVDRFGRILLPKSLRDRLNLRPGSRLLVEVSNEEITLQPADARPVLSTESGVLVFQGELLGDPEAVLEAVRQERLREVGGA